MGSDSAEVAQNAKKVILNIGCGWRKHPDGINVDGFEACKPDVLWNLNQFPYPWPDNSVDEIFAYHVMEHLEDWWGAFSECARILKVGGRMELRVPDASSDTATVYRDHLQVISLFSFDGIVNRLGGRQLNAWAASQNILPMLLKRYAKVPFAEYNWIPIWLLKWLGKHCRNYIWEQRFLFEKVDKRLMPYVEYGHPKTEYLKKMKPYKPERRKVNG